MDISLTLILIGITVIISFMAFKNDDLKRRWMFTPYLINNKNQWDRFVLSGFIHKDNIHLFFNMFTFYFFGPIVENTLNYRFSGIMGTLLFVMFYIISIVISDLPTYFKNKNNSYYHALGASGGVAGIVFSSIIISPLTDLCLFGLICLPGFILGTLFLVYSYYQSKKVNDGINHDAHFYGAVFGIAFTLLLMPDLAANFLNQIKNFRPF
jgi:membrane associated rhomboid family serine protease